MGHNSLAMCMAQKCLVLKRFNKKLIDEIKNSFLWNRLTWKFGLGIPAIMAPPTDPVIAKVPKIFEPAPRVNVLSSKKNPGPKLAKLNTSLQIVKKSVSSNCRFFLLFEYWLFFILFLGMFFLWQWHISSFQNLFFYLITQFKFSICQTLKTKTAFICTGQ